MFVFLLPALRLTGGTASTNGMLEVYYNSEWGTVCDDGFTDAAATVVCNQLGLASFGTFIPSGTFTPSSQPTIWLDDVSCTGGEAILDLCTHAPYGTHNCGHGEDVGIQCGDREFQLEITFMVFIFNFFLQPHLLLLLTV